jgi:hypothetical protein
MMGSLVFRGEVIVGVELFRRVSSRLRPMPWNAL